MVIPDGSWRGAAVTISGPDGAIVAACVVLSIWLTWRTYDGVHDTRAQIREWRHHRRNRVTLRITSSHAPWR